MKPTLCSLSFLLVLAACGDDPVTGHWLLDGNADYGYLDLDSELSGLAVFNYGEGLIGYNVTAAPESDGECRLDYAAHDPEQWVDVALTCTLSSSADALACDARTSEGKTFELGYQRDARTEANAEVDP